MIDIEKLRGLLAAATPGPWRQDKTDWADPIVGDTGDAVFWCDGVGGGDWSACVTDDDAQFICALVNAAPELLDGLEQLRRDLAIAVIERDAALAAERSLHERVVPVYGAACKQVDAWRAHWANPDRSSPPMIGPLAAAVDAARKAGT